MTRATTWTAMLGAAMLLLLPTAPAQAQTATYKCVSRGSVTYSQKPCPGGRPLGVKAPRHTDRSRAVPQDRAKIARRAPLSAADRQECRSLDGRLLEQQAALKALGAAATLQDEMPLVHTKKRLRELRC